MNDKDQWIAYHKRKLFPNSRAWPKIVLGFGRYALVSEYTPLRYSSRITDVCGIRIATTEYVWEPMCSSKAFTQNRHLFTIKEIA